MKVLSAIEEMVGADIIIPTQNSSPSQELATEVDAHPSQEPTVLDVNDHINETVNRRE